MNPAPELTIDGGQRRNPATPEADQAEKAGKVMLSLAVLLAIAMPVTAAQPSADSQFDAIYQAAHAGHIEQAQQILAKVLHDHPQSGRAHFVDAELLLQQGLTGPARAQLAEAERIAPTLPFASTEAAGRLRTALSAGQDPGATESRKGDNSLIWSVLLAIGAGAASAWLLMRPERNQ